MAVYKKELRGMGGYLTDGSKVYNVILVGHMLASAVIFHVISFVYNLFCFIPVFSQPCLSRVEHFIQAIGSYEDKIFQKRARLHQVSFHLRCCIVMCLTEKVDSLSVVLYFTHFRSLVSFYEALKHIFFTCSMYWTPLTPVLP